VASKKRARNTGSHAGSPAKRASAQRGEGSRNRLYLAIAGAAIAVVAVAVVVVAVLSSGGSSTTARDQWTVPGSGGSWTSVTADKLATMMQHKDFTLVNVKTPYIGEIDGTDSYIPYDQITARVSELPSDKSARILVYCRSGVESAQAAQSLIGLGYKNIWNLDGGMNAWTASGRSLINKGRT
jgi:rhodanese-related sulfurtransferase